HAPDWLPARTTPLRRRSHRIARLRRRRCAQQHAVANDCRSQGERQRRREGMSLSNRRISAGKSINCFATGFCLIALSVAAARQAEAAKARIMIASEPAGANVELNGRFIGTTPLSWEVEDYVVKPPRFLWSNFLNEPMEIRIWKEGFL